MTRGTTKRRARGRPGVVAALAALVVGLTAGVPGPGTDVAWAAPAPAAVPPKPALLDLPVQPRVLIMGDSYTEGWGADPKTEGFAFKVAGPLGWRVTRDGIGATGYTNVGLKQQGTYPQRLWRHPADGYDLVVLQGGSNDERRPEAEITTAVDFTVRTVRRRYPSAQILVMGPIEPYGTVSERRAKVTRVLTASTTKSSLLFIDPSAEHWFVKGDSTTLVNPEKGHPNNAGYAHIADLFVRDVRALSVVRPVR
ncbi:MAG: SGNH/GDSL hydrolase family protein [Propionibacteriaceae bacterium]|nr:MAG: SGNH/GDSL hydrolase family protein [Propionibacteriaceae bacterium]